MNAEKSNLPDSQPRNSSVREKMDSGTRLINLAQDHEHEWDESTDVTDPLMKRLLDEFPPYSAEADDAIKLVAGNRPTGTRIFVYLLNNNLVGLSSADTLEEYVRLVKIARERSPRPGPEPDEDIGEFSQRDTVPSVRYEDLITPPKSTAPPESVDDMEEISEVRQLRGRFGQILSRLGGK